MFSDLEFNLYCSNITLNSTKIESPAFYYSLERETIKANMTKIELDHYFSLSSTTAETKYITNLYITHLTFTPNGV